MYVVVTCWVTMVLLKVQTTQKSMETINCAYGG